MNTKTLSKINFGLWTAIGVAIGANYGVWGAILGVSISLTFSIVAALIQAQRSGGNLP